MRHKIGCLVARLLIGTLVAGLFSAVTLAVTATSASAASSKVVGKTSFRDCTTLSRAGCKPARGAIASGSAVRMVCWVDDSWSTERYRSNRWFYVVGPNAKRGFVHSSRIVNQVGVGHCNHSRYIAPARWAAMHVGDLKPRNVKEKLSNSFTYWSGWCQVFAQAAHTYGYNNSPYYGYGSAKTTFYAYKRHGKVSTNFDHNRMPIGALVYWTTGDYGHVAVYVGNGFVIGTRGSSQSNPLPVSRNSLSYMNSLLGRTAGWVHPSEV